MVMLNFAIPILGCAIFSLSVNSYSLNIQWKLTEFVAINEYLGHHTIFVKCFDFIHKIHCGHILGSLSIGWIFNVDSVPTHTNIHIKYHWCSLYHHEQNKKSHQLQADFSIKKQTPIFAIVYFLCYKVQVDYVCMFKLQSDLFDCLLDTHFSMCFNSRQHFSPTNYNNIEKVKV